MYMAGVGAPAHPKNMSAFELLVPTAPDPTRPALAFPLQSWGVFSVAGYSHFMEWPSRLQICLWPGGWCPLMVWRAGGGQQMGHFYGKYYEIISLKASDNYSAPDRSK